MKKNILSALVIFLIAPLSFAGVLQGQISNWSNLSSYCTGNYSSQQQTHTTQQAVVPGWTVSCTDSIEKWEPRDLIGSEVDRAVIVRPKARTISWAGLFSKGVMEIESGAEDVVSDEFSCNVYHKVKLIYTAKFDLKCSDFLLYSGFQNFCLSRIGNITGHAIQSTDEGGEYQWVDLDVAPRFACGLMELDEMAPQLMQK